MTQALDEYIVQNKVCSDLIFRDWDAFLEILFDCGGCVEEIVWFEYVLIEKQKDSLGGGGYRDPENSEYMWSETLLHDRALEQMSLTDIKNYIAHTVKSHKPHDLVPCFFVVRK